MNTGLILAWLVIGWTVIDTLWKRIDNPVKVDSKHVQASPFYLAVVVAVGLVMLAFAIATVV